MFFVTRSVSYTFNPVLTGERFVSSCTQFISFVYNRITNARLIYPPVPNFEVY